MFLAMIEAAKEPLYLGSKETVLGATIEFLSIKSNTNMSQATYNHVVSTHKRMFPKPNKAVSNFYEAKKLVRQLGLSYEKIDARKNDCMFFYKKDVSKRKCSVCGHSRYKPRRKGSTKHKTNVPFKQLRYMPLISRLQRLYIGKSTTEATR